MEKILLQYFSEFFPSSPTLGQILSQLYPELLVIGVILSLVPVVAGVAVLGLWCWVVGKCFWCLITGKPL